MGRRMGSFKVGRNETDSEVEWELGLNALQIITFGITFRTLRLRSSRECPSRSWSWCWSKRAEQVDWECQCVHVDCDEFSGWCGL